METSLGIRKEKKGRRDLRRSVFTFQTTTNVPAKIFFNCPFHDSNRHPGKNIPVKMYLLFVYSSEVCKVDRSVHINVVICKMLNSLNYLKKTER